LFSNGAKITIMVKQQQARNTKIVETTKKKLMVFLYFKQLLKFFLEDFQEF
jgi:hypothetical protein